MTDLDKLLLELEACEEARDWAKTQPDLSTAWANCQRPDWMLWLLARTGVAKDDSRYRLMACDFAESVLHLVPAGEDRARQAVEVARRYARGEATQEELAAAASAASAAAWASTTAWATAAGAASAAAAAASAAAAQADVIRSYFPEVLK